MGINDVFSMVVAKSEKADYKVVEINESAEKIIKAFADEFGIHIGLGHVMLINNKPYVTAPGWDFIGAKLVKNITGKWIICDYERKLFHYEATVELKSGGIRTADGICDANEVGKGNKKLHDIMATAQTRGIRRALSKLLGIVGMDELPEEEIKNPVDILKADKPLPKDIRHKSIKIDSVDEPAPSKPVEKKPQTIEIIDEEPPTVDPPIALPKSQPKPIAKEEPVFSLDLDLSNLMGPPEPVQPVIEALKRLEPVIELPNRPCAECDLLGKPECPHKEVNEGTRVKECFKDVHWELAKLCKVKYGAVLHVMQTILKDLQAKNIDPTPDGYMEEQTKVYVEQYNVDMLPVIQEALHQYYAKGGKA